MTPCFYKGCKQKVRKHTAHCNKHAGEHAVAFIQQLKHTKGKWAGQPFILFKWQKKIIIFLGVYGKKIILYQSLLKKDNFEWVVQKGTELGVSTFVPIIASNTIVRKIFQIMSVLIGLYYMFGVQMIKSG